MLFQYVIIVIFRLHLPPEMVTTAYSRGVMTKRGPGPAFGKGHGKDDDQQDEQGLPHGLVLAVPVFFALFFAHHVKKAQHGHTEGHDAGQIEHEDGIHTIS